MHLGVFVFACCGACDKENLQALFNQHILLHDHGGSTMSHENDESPGSACYARPHQHCFKSVIGFNYLPVVVRNPQTSL